MSMASSDAATPTPLPQLWANYSGGGWNSSSSLAGLVAGGLDGLAAAGRSADLSTLMGAVKGIGATSGGSWFLSQLAWSLPFAAGLEQPAARDAFNSTGYNGQVAALFRGTSANGSGSTLVSDFVNTLPGRMRLKWQPLSDEVQYYANLLGAIGDSGLSWRYVVDRFVYAPYGMGADLGSKGLDAVRQSWAADKDLLITAAAQSSPTVLDDRGAPLFNKIFSAVSPQDKSLPPQGVVTPLSFLSQVGAAGSRPSAAALFTSGDVNLDLSTNKWLANPASLGRPLSAHLASTVSVIDATTASSSARALLAAPQTFGSSSWSLGLRNTAAALLRDLAPVAQIENGTLSMPAQLPAAPAGASSEEAMALYRDKGINRLADGGFVDATSAAFSLRQIQDTTGINQPFSLTLLINSAADPMTGIQMPVGPGATDLSSFRVVGDVAKLFGNFNGTGNDGPTIASDVISGYQLQVPSPRIFDIRAWTNEKPDWTYQKGSIDISYFDLNVTTVDNSAFGIKGGQPGRLQLFLTNNQESSSAPTTPAILAEYSENYDVVRDAIANQGGFSAFSQALGLQLPPPVV